MVNDLTTTTILLVIGILLLWMAITDKLGRLLDAYDVITGKAKASGVSQVSNPGGGGSGTVPVTVASSSGHFQLPSLPPIALTNPQVPATYYQGVQS